MTCVKRARQRDDYFSLISGLGTRPNNPSPPTPGHHFLVLNIQRPRPRRVCARVCVVDPNMMPTMRVDKGAISFVMNGANIMCQGFTSKGGRIDTPLEAGEAVVSLTCISSVCAQELVPLRVSR